METSLRCPECNFAFAKYDDETRMYRVHVPTRRHLGKRAFVAPVQVICTRCVKEHFPATHSIQAPLNSPYICSNHKKGVQLTATETDELESRSVFVELATVEQEILCADASMECFGECGKWFDLEKFRMTGETLPGIDYSHLISPVMSQ